LETQQRLREINLTANVEVNQGLIDAFGGADIAQSQQEQFYQSFVSDTDKIKDLKNRLTQDLGYVPRSKEQYLALVKQIDLSTKAGKERYALLIKESQSFSDMIDLQSKLGEEATNAQKDNAKKVQDAWKEAYKSVRESLTSTIEQVLNIGKEKDTKGTLVQDLVNYNRLKAQLKQELGKKTLDSEKVNKLSSRLSSSSLEVANNKRFSSQNALAQDLQSLRDSLPSERVQRVEIVNSNDTITLNKILTSLHGENNLSVKSAKLLEGILEELETANR